MISTKCTINNGVIKVNQYKLNPEEIAKIVSLYAKITDPEKRIYAQGYLNGLSATSSAFSSCCGDEKAQAEPDGPQAVMDSTYEHNEEKRWKQ